jgi:membrane protein
LTERSPSRRAFDFGRRLGRGLQTYNAFESAASIAFWFFLSLVPLLVLLGFLVGHFARSRGVDALVTPLLEVVPDTAEDMVRKELERMAGSASSLAPVGVIGYFWTASSGLHNLMDVFETATKVARRPWWQKRVIALGWVLGGLVAACVVAWSLVQTDAVLQAYDSSSPSKAAVAGAPSGSTGPPASSSAARGPTDLGAQRGGAVARARGALKHRVHKALHTPLEEAIASAVMLVVGLAFLAGFYRFAVVHPTGVRRRVWPGAVTAIASWLVVSWAFGLYAVSMSTYALYYGSLAAVAVMLVWLYLTSLSLIVGAEVNAQLERAVV